MRPYEYDDTPEVIFRDVMEQYNSAMAGNEWKQFEIGSVTVEGDAFEFESDSAEKVREVVEKLIEECGGYIIFDFASNGRRQINWLDQLPYTCNQEIAFGSNLTDYSSEVDNPDFCTRLIPYGASKDDDKLTIDVDGKDYVENAEAVAKYGIIEGTKDYNDIEDADELLEAAQKDVDAMSSLPPVVEIDAVDLSRQDSSLDDFRIGQLVPCRSVPHDMNGVYALLSIKEDLIDPKSGKVTLTYESSPSVNISRRTLSGAVAVGMRSSSDAKALARQSYGMSRNKLSLHPVNTCVEIYGQDTPDILFGGGVWEVVSTNETSNISTWRRTE